MGATIDGVGWLDDADSLILSMAESMGTPQAVCLAFLFGGGNQRWKKRSCFMDRLCCDKEMNS